MEECRECGVLTEVNKDGNCEECHEALMEEWAKENEELNNYWRSTRL